MTTLIRHLTLHSTTEPCMGACALNHTRVITELEKPSVPTTSRCASRVSQLPVRGGGVICARHRIGSAASLRCDEEKMSGEPTAAGMSAHLLSTEERTSATYAGR
jgi:hypothetical protein